MSGMDKEIVHYLDMDKFKNATDEQRREMLREMLVAIRKKGKEDVKKD